jgi:Sulfotransferase family
VTTPAVTREAIKNYFPEGGLERRLQPVPRYRCIYVRNAKVATGSTLLWLHRLHTGDHEFTPTRHIYLENELPRVWDVGWDEVLRMLNGEGFRFSFVRDPVRRVESAYLSKVLKHRRYPGRAALQETLGLPVGRNEELTFEQFITAIEMQDPLRMDAHWRPQHLNLGHGLIEYDLVGRLENFAADAARVRDATGMPDIPMPQWNASKVSAAGLLDGRPDLLRKVHEIYARDFDLYGY